MPKLHKLLQLSLAEEGTLLQAAMMLPLSAFALRVAGLKSWQETLSRFRLRSAPPLSHPAISVARQARRTARLVMTASRRRAYRFSCLSESVTLWWLLRRQGIESVVYVGVRKPTSRLEAHAWVECSGVVLNDADDVRERFAAFRRAIAPALSGTS
jgi:hypothetical protein